MHLSFHLKMELSQLSYAKQMTRFFAKEKLVIYNNCWVITIKFYNKNSRLLKVYQWIKICRFRLVKKKKMALLNIIFHSKCE